MRRFLSIVGLEGYAVALALLQFHIGVRTDEAKYLLNIPYPHPPLARTILGWTDAWADQELFWRIVFATLLVQAVWFLGVARNDTARLRWIIRIAWLTSAAVILQAGTVMMAPLTALYGLVFVAVMVRGPGFAGAPQADARPSRHGEVRRSASNQAGVVALLWLAALFTSYQSILYAPLAWVALRRSGTSRVGASIYLGAPIVLLVLYTMTSPIIMATFVIHSTETAHATLVDRASGAMHLWLLGGGYLLSPLAMYGLLRSRSFALLLSLALVAGYVFFSVPFPFYAILFTPLLMAGLMHVMVRPAFVRLGGLRHGKQAHHDNAALGYGLVGAHILATVLLVWRTGFPGPSQARQVMQAVYAQGTDIHMVLINGPFGHEWEYEAGAMRDASEEMSPAIERYRPDAVDNASAIICLTSCPTPDPAEWRKVTGIPAEAWVRTST